MEKAKCKFIFVTGGVLSGLGKGIVASSLGNILKSKGYKLTIQKLDQYINVDAGTLNPGEHGEVFVTDDGAEADLDLGHYERFIDQNLTKLSSVMTGSIYQKVIEKERRGDFLGKTVQFIPHVVNEVKERVISLAKESSVELMIIEIGGTIGDYEGAHFLEALRQLRNEYGPENTCFVHVVYLPWLEASGELKTKPAQNSIRDLRAIGINADMIVARADYPVDERLREKLSLFCDVPVRHVIPLETVSSVYEVPLILENLGMHRAIINKFGLKKSAARNSKWDSLVSIIKNKKPNIEIGLVGKYTSMKDTYMSVTEALKTAAWHNGYEAKIVWVDSEALERKKDLSSLSSVKGIIVPGGFGVRGIEGKIIAAKYARENKLPYLGLCLGMQIMVIEFARSILNWKDANSTEFNNNCRYPVIHIMESQEFIKNKGGTMRLGSWPCVLDKTSKCYKAYKKVSINERHRHRYEFNNEFKDQLQAAGLLIAGASPDGQLVEVTEIKKHPWFVGVQFHPEFKSRPARPHPLFMDFIKASIKNI